MITTQTVHCPNCGQQADRLILKEQSLMRTSCSHCDYLLITCLKTGAVIEAYYLMNSEFNYGDRPMVSS